MKKVLVIDDEKDIVDAIEIILEREGYIVSTLSKADQIYKAAIDFKPDLILLDILLSGSDGRVLSKTLKSRKDTSFTPIIMMSAHPSAMKEYNNFGGDAFLAKPFETEELLQVIKKYI